MAKEIDRNLFVVLFSFSFIPFFRFRFHLNQNDLLPMEYKFQSIKSMERNDFTGCNRSFGMDALEGDHFFNIEKYFDCDRMFY